MPLLLGLSFLIAIYFAIHAVRTGQDRYWLFIMFSFPFLGSAVYFFAFFSLPVLPLLLPFQQL